MGRIRVAALALDGVVSFDLACAVQAFNRSPDPSGKREHFQLRTCGVGPGPVTTPDGYRLEIEHGLEELRAADLAVVPGHQPHDGGLPDVAAEALRDAHERGATIASICVGAFLLADAGMLDGRPATTHWAYCDSLARAHPQVDVRPRDLFVDDGDILTSAGLAAGLDMCLHLVRREVGTAAASRLARWNVVAPFRDGGQAQFIPATAPLAVEGEIGETVAWARRQLADRPTVARMARHACMSERTFSRRFVAEMGVAPKRWLLDQQTQLARDLLEHTDLPVEAIAAQAGFPSAATLRVQFRRRTSTTPSAYRARFNSGRSPAPTSRRFAEPPVDAVREALRNLDSPPTLSRSELAQGDGVEERAASVRKRLVDAAECAFGDDHRGELLRRVVDRGYLDPAPSHELAAEELHLSRAAFYRWLRQARELLAAAIAEDGRA